MNTLPMTTTKWDRTKKIGAVTWFVVSKIAQAVIFVLKKINWKKVGFVGWRLAVLVFLIAIVCGKLVGSLIVGLFKMIVDGEEEHQSEESAFDPFWHRSDLLLDKPFHYEALRRQLHYDDD